MSLRLASIDPDGVVCVAADGEITFADTSQTSGNLLQTLLGENWMKHRLLLDMSRTQYIDSSAVAWLIDTHKKLGEGGGRLVVHSVQPPVRQVLKLLRIDQLISLVPDQAAARQALTENKA